MRPPSLVAFLLALLLCLAGISNALPSSFQSGLLPVTRNSSLFYWYCPPSRPASRPRPPSSATPAPLILWLQGGPGASGLVGLLYEMGPYRLETVGGR
jgi:vitellogenic carboxypeptidase-like protein